MQTTRQSLKALPLERQYETLQDLFSWSAYTYSHQHALEFDGQLLTYGELHSLANRFAAYLRSHGVRKGDFVVLYMPRGIDMFIGMLGILEAGAVYVPIDPHSPLERVTYVYKDCQAKFIVTSSSLMKPDFSLACLFLDQIRDDLKSLQVLPNPKEPSTGDELAYVIYTSGSTGQPKGVMIRHHSIVHFVHSESSILKIRSDDIVLQGFSLSFDMSLEEIWTTFFAGAKLIIASHELMTSGPDLAPILSTLGVTVWHCVPTLLAMQKDDIPSLRLLNLGGEACPANLVDRWARNGRRLVNTYGPTETTVTATYAELKPNRPVTIGKSLPGYETYIVDEAMMPVMDGREGELCIAGPGLAAGYLNRPDLTREKFMNAPFQRKDGSPIFFYRTGDLVRRNTDKEIEFLGRFDTQIKIRGFRVELSEIESVLMQEPGVQTAIVALLKDQHAFDTLVAFILLKPQQKFQEALAWQDLRSKLPPYMIPAILETVQDLPRLPSGKVDRKLLRFPERTTSPQKALKKPSSATEKKIHAVWTEIFAPIPVSTEDDFFLDLGGHSLRAALMVSKLRKDQGLSSVSIQAVYKHRTIASLASFLDSKEAEYQTREGVSRSFQEIPRLRYVQCLLGQAAGLGVLFTVLSVMGFLPYLAYVLSIDQGKSILTSLASSLSVFALLLPVSFCLSAGVKWLLIGKYQEGDYPLWGSYYLRWWLVRRFHSLVPCSFLVGTPLLNFYFRLMGAKLGKNVYLNTDSCDTWDLLSIGEGSAISQGVTFSCSSIEGGLLKLRTVKIGPSCFVGNGAVVGMTTVMEAGAQLEDLSLLSNNRTIPPGEVWAGSPARLQSRVETIPPLDQNKIPLSIALCQAVLACLLPLIALAPIMPGLIWILNRQTYDWTFFTLTPLLAFSYIFLSCLLIVAMKWLVLGKLKSSDIPLASFAYLRFWFANRLMEMSLTYIRPLYATLYLAPWFRMLGVKLGKRAEVSTASGVTWDLLTIADECFVADGVTLGVPRTWQGHVELRPTSIGRRTFLGNSALIPGGTELSDNMLIGCLSVPPRLPEQRAQSCASWFGSPAIYLPQRQIFNQFDESSTFYPPKKLYALRLFIEFIRVILPMTLSILLSSLVVMVIYRLLHSSYAIWQILPALPILFLAYGVAAVCLTVLIKKVLIGTYTPTIRPLWSHFVWRSELVTTLYENLPVPALLDHLRGTPFLNIFLRMMGSKIGKRVYNDTTDITEHDVIEVGDDAALNEHCGLQTHLFEERIMKVSKVSIGARCTVGSASIVLYDAVMENDSQLGDLSMLMKGETLPARTEWEGLPAQRVR